MFPSFTGSARRRRQVNLSGRNNNPFAAQAGGSRTSASSQISHNALVQAQQERALRQQERERPPAATKIQKTWRGHKERKVIRNKWRQEWDEKEEWHPSSGSKDQRQNFAQVTTFSAAFSSEVECLSSLRLLVQFASPSEQDDILRLCYFSSRYLRSMPTQPTSPADVWTFPRLRLTKLTLASLNVRRSPSLPSYVVDGLLSLLQSLATTIPMQLAPYAQGYFKTLAKIIASHRSENSELLLATVLALLRPVTSRVDSVYEGFASEFLTVPELPVIFDHFEAVAENTRYVNLVAAIDKLLFPSTGPDLLQCKKRESLLWFLAYFIYFRRRTFSEKNAHVELPDAFYVKIVSRLISSLADDIGNRIDASGTGSPTHSETIHSKTQPQKPLPAFVRSEVLTLINQDNVSSLLANIDMTSVPRNGFQVSANEASSLASYALTLLRAFPRRGDEIRMWLYRGSTSRQVKSIRGRAVLPAIKYFYQAASGTNIFEKISKDPRETVSMLKPDRIQDLGSSPQHPVSIEAHDQQWRVILLFLELYTFVLKVMDDEEFLSGTVDSNTEWSWTRQSALPLDQVKDLTLFLKNLAFSLHWNASEIAGIEATETKTSLAEYFGTSRSTQNQRIQDSNAPKAADMSIAGVSGMTLAYLKGMVTGVLRMIYERE